MITSVFAFVFHNIQTYNNGAISNTRLTNVWLVTKPAIGDNSSR